ncbi:ATP-binding protein [Sulfitobacter sp.]|uniref:ATP-binding protein n=1 Tax=Sulfitobacter sp. TaxID=1903071 RepID=UPI0032981403
MAMAESPRLAPFTVSLPGREDAVRGGLTKTMARLCDLKLSKDEAGTVELVLAEALNNIIEHALSASVIQTRITIRGDASPQGLELTIIDHGVPMPKGVAPIGLQPDVDVPVQDLPEGGYGWFMIHTLATKVQYARVKHENHLTILLPVGI